MAATTGKFPGEPESYIEEMRIVLDDSPEFPNFHCCLPIQIIKYLKYRHYFSKSNETILNTECRKRLYSKWLETLKKDVTLYDRLADGIENVYLEQISFNDLFVQFQGQHKPVFDLNNDVPSDLFTLLAIWLSLVFFDRHLRNHPMYWNVNYDPEKIHHEVGCIHCPKTAMKPRVLTRKPAATTITLEDDSCPKQITLGVETYLDVTKGQSLDPMEFQRQAEAEINTMLKSIERFHVIFDMIPGIRQTVIQRKASPDLRQSVRLMFRVFN